MLDIERNIIYCSNHRLLAGDWSGKYRMDRNVFWSLSQDPLEFSGRPLDAWRAKGHDVSSVVADPLFLDVEHRDFRLKPESPALKLGFQPIDVSKIGLYGEPEWRALPAIVPFRRDDPIPPKRRSETIDDGFERSAPGTSPFRAMPIAWDGASVVVTEEAACARKHSVKFTDRKCGNPFSPYLYYEPVFETGRIRFSCDVLNQKDQPADIAIQMRDWRVNPTFYQKLEHPEVGPNCRIGPDGRVFINGESVMRAPLGQWVHVEMKFMW